MGACISHDDAIAPLLEQDDCDINSLYTYLYTILMYSNCDDTSNVNVVHMCTDENRILILCSTANAPYTAIDTLRHIGEKHFF